jgi:hypothetical protein
MLCCAVLIQIYEFSEFERDILLDISQIIFLWMNGASSGGLAMLFFKIGIKIDYGKVTNSQSHEKVSVHITVSLVNRDFFCGTGPGI